MVLSLSTLRKPVNRQVVDPSTGLIREDWDLFLQQLVGQLNSAVGELGSDLAPADADYIVGTANDTLSAERVVTDTATVDVDLGTAGQAKWNVIDDSITFAKLQNITSDRLIGRDTASSGDPEEISVGGGLEFTGSGGIQRSALTGDVVASAGSNSTTIQTDAVTTSKIINDAVTYAKLQNVSATSRILGRKTSGAGDVEECTLSEVLDFAGSAAQGDLLFRGASGWARLGAGTERQRLVTRGAGADPEWASAPVAIASGSLSGTQIDIVSIPQVYNRLRLHISGLSHNSGSNQRPIVRASFNNGSSFLAGTDYFNSAVNTAQGNTFGPATPALDSLVSDIASRAASQTWTGTVEIFSYTGNGYPHWITHLTANGAAHLIHTGALLSASAINALRITLSGGSFDGGTYALYGVL